MHYTLSVRRLPAGEDAVTGGKKHHLPFLLLPLHGRNSAILLTCRSQQNPTSHITPLPHAVQFLSR